MRFVILGDTHFGGGYSLGKVDPQKQLNSRLLDHIDTMGSVIDFCADNFVDVLIITGDIFEHRRPDSAQISLFSELLARLADLGIHTHIVIGNHDIIRSHNATTIDMLKKLKLSHVHVWSEIETVHIGDVNFIFLPYRTRQMLQCSTNKEAVNFLSDRLQFEIKSIDNNDPVIVVGHFAIQSAKAHGVLLDFNTVSEIVLPVEMFKDIDATIMGHIHQHQVVSDNPFVTHVGSMERTDFGEADENKYFLVVDMEKKPKYEFKLLKLRNLYDIKIDQTKTTANVMEKIQKEIEEFSYGKDMIGSIVRVEILVNDMIISDIDSSKIFKMLYDFGIYHCVGVHSSIVSKRQLRSSEITERLNPKESFEKWIELESVEPDMIDKLKFSGYKIIKEIGGTK